MAKRPRDQVIIETTMWFLNAPIMRSLLVKTSTNRCDEMEKARETAKEKAKEKETAKRKGKEKEIYPMAIIYMILIPLITV